MVNHLLAFQSIIGNTHSVSGIDVIHCPNCFRRFHNGSSLDRDAVAESFALAIYDARHEDVASDSMGLSSLDDYVVRRYCLGACEDLVH